MEVKSHFHHMMSEVHASTGLITGNDKLDHLVEEVFARFLHDKISFPSFLTLVFVRKSLSTAHSRGESSFTILK